MRPSEKSHTGQARDSHPTRAVLRELARPSWTSSSIGPTIPLPSAVSFFSGKLARESHRLRMRLHVASTRCTVLRHPSSFCGRSNPNGRLINSSRLSLAISPTAIPSFKTALGRVVKDNSSLRVGTRDYETLFQSLILEPLKDLHIVGPILVVIDALDESGDVTGRNGLHTFLPKNLSNYHRISVCSSPRDPSTASSLRFLERLQASGSNT
jgi:hypothetical protein